MAEYAVRPWVGQVPIHLLIYKQATHNSMFISLHDENNAIVYTGVVRPFEENGAYYIGVKLYDIDKNSVVRKSLANDLDSSEAIAREMLNLVDLCVKEFEYGTNNNQHLES